MKVCLTPSPATAPTNNGIGRVLYAMGKYLPQMGVSLVEDPSSADVVAFHAGTAQGLRVDVLHCHGLYWSDLPHAEFNSFNQEANRRILDAARRAKVITVPSDWVAEPFRRDMRIEPVVIGHGIEISEWEPAENYGYLLWNKNRPTDVCDPAYAVELAKRGVPVVSTFGKAGQLYSNLKVTGQLPFEQMKSIVQSADIYLSTAPETFGIGTLEAMACGIPVLGFDWCGTRDLVKHRETGWLVEPGDVDGLEEGYHWLHEHRQEVGALAREAVQGFDWPFIVEKYVQVYQQAQRPEPAGVSIVITNYNYGHWVGKAIDSCLQQNVKPDEIIVVDDGSKDSSKGVIEKYVKSGQVQAIYQSNQGVAAARNNGVAAARHPFIVCLDADDQIAPEYVAALKPALMADRGLGVAYPGVKFIKENGIDSGFITHRFFDWGLQSKFSVPPPTCIPSGSMFRKAMWERCGGYKQKYAPGEDTEFWTHGLSLGFTAMLVTPEAFFWYRGHPNSASRTRKYVPIDDNKPWLHDRRYPMAAPATGAVEVRSYYKPLVSVVIPVGPGHEQHLEKAIESVLSQTVREWELIVVDDTGSEMPKPARYPFIRWFKTAGRAGAGAARNVGIEKARGGFVLFLDADDWLTSDAMDSLLQGHKMTGLYTYSDYFMVENGTITKMRSYPYDRAMYLKEQVMHSVTALVPTRWAREVGGFDPALPGWEEYDFYMKLAVRGHCGIPVRKPLFYYQSETGTRRKVSQKMADKLNAEFAKRFKGVKMAGCCGNNDSILEVKRALGLIPKEAVNFAELPNEVRLEFTGEWMGPVGFQVNGRTYYGAKDGLHRFINVPKEDVERLVSTRKWRIVPPPPDDQRMPAVESQPEVAVAVPVDVPMEPVAAPAPAPASVKPVSKYASKKKRSG